MQNQRPQPGLRQPSRPGTLISGVASATLTLLFFTPWLSACSVQVSGADLATRQFPGQPYPWWLLGIPIVGVAGVLMAISLHTKPPIVAGRRARWMAALSCYPLLCVFLIYVGVKNGSADPDVAGIVAAVGTLIRFEFGFWGTAMAAVAMLCGAILDMRAAGKSPASWIGPPASSGVVRGPVPGGDAWLVGLSGEGVGRTISLSAGSIRIGRHHGNEVILTDPDVSRGHAVVCSARGRHFVQDQNSASGTYVNGRRVDAIELRPGDIIRIGTSEFVFRQRDR